MPGATARPLLFEPEFLRRLERLEIVSRKIFAGKLRGEKRSRRKGFSQEFADFRDYAHGDDLRFLDWNAYGRLDRLFLKLFYEEEDLHVHLFLDASRSMDTGDPHKFDYARRVCAAIAYVGLVNLNPVSLRVIRKAGQASLPALRGERSARRMLDFLAAQAPEGETDLAGALKDFAMRRPRRGVAILISDFMDRAGPEAALRPFLSTGMEGHAIQILSPQEIEPDLRGDFRLMDMEDADTVEVSLTGGLLKSYARTLAAFRAGLTSACNRYGIAYTFASTRVPFDDLVMLYLRRAGLVS